VPRLAIAFGVRTSVDMRLVYVNKVYVTAIDCWWEDNFLVFLEVSGEKIYYNIIIE
jgi:hypothetical protein